MKRTSVLTIALCLAPATVCVPPKPIRELRQGVSSPPEFLASLPTDEGREDCSGKHQKKVVLTEDRPRTQSHAMHQSRGEFDRHHVAGGEQIPTSGDFPVNQSPQ